MRVLPGPARVKRAQSGMGIRIVTLVESGATVVHIESGWVDFVVDGRRTHLLAALLA